MTTAPNSTVILPGKIHRIELGLQGRTQDLEGEDNPYTDFEPELESLVAGSSAAAQRLLDLHDAVEDPNLRADWMKRSVDCTLSHAELLEANGDIAGAERLMSDLLAKHNRKPAFKRELAACRQIPSQADRKR